ncbi:hypothetical protein TcWFU_004391 [Taenia crassiceps]|uniref:Uncharacterized protein n=1 Tax=Taenia crassiceps TaxID=6207 RepID=A0ABR4QL17_9CEST
MLNPTRAHTTSSNCSACARLDTTRLDATTVGRRRRGDEGVNYLHNCQRVLSHVAMLHMGGNRPSTLYHSPSWSAGTCTGMLTLALCTLLDEQWRSHPISVFWDKYRGENPEDRELPSKVSGERVFQSTSRPLPALPVPTCEARLLSPHSMTQPSRCQCFPMLVLLTPCHRVFAVPRTTSRGPLPPQCPRLPIVTSLCCKKTISVDCLSPRGAQRVTEGSALLFVVRRWLSPLNMGVNIDGRVSSVALALRKRRCALANNLTRR